GERGERGGLRLAPLAKLLAVRRRRGARGVARPRVAEDVAALEARAVRRLLEREVVGEVQRVVARVDPRDEDVGGAGGGAERRPRPGPPRPAAVAGRPEDAER